MEENIKLLLLKIIKFNGDITPLLKLNYDYAQVAKLIRIETEEGNARYDDGSLYLTEQGNKLIDKLEKKRKPGSDQWIEPEIESRITPIAKNYVYLPNRKELSF